MLMFFEHVESHRPMSKAEADCKYSSPPARGALTGGVESAAINRRQTGGSGLRFPKKTLTPDGPPAKTLTTLGARDCHAVVALLHQ